MNGVDMDGLSAMLDGGESATSTPEVPVTEAPATSNATGSDAPTTTEPDTFPRSYVEELRQEAAKYRNKAKQFEAFESYSDEDREVWTHLAKTIVEDPKAGAQLLQDIAKNLTAEEQQELADAMGEQEPKYMTLEDYKRLQSEQEMNQRVAAIERDAQGLGYQLGSTQYKHLLLVASNETGGDIHKAHEAIEGQKQRIIDEYLASKARDAEGNPGVPASGGMVPSNARPITNFKDAQAAMAEFLRAQ